MPMGGWSEADRKGGPLHDPAISDAFIQKLKHDLDSKIEIKEATLHNWKGQIIYCPPLFTLKCGPQS